MSENSAGVAVDEFWVCVSAGIGTSTNDAGHRYNDKAKRQRTMQAWLAEPVELQVDPCANREFSLGNATPAAPRWRARRRIPWRER